MDDRAEAIDILTRMSTNHFYGHREQEAFKLGAEALKLRWIPVTERLPEEKDAGILKALRIEKRSEYVLATVDVKGEKMTATACTLDGKWNWDLKYAFPDFKVVAWMPLPTPYKGGEEE